MESQNIAQIDSGYSRITATERFASQRRLVALVIAAYRAVHDLSVIIAFDPTRDASNPSPNRWSVNACHFKVDVSNAVQRAIEGKPKTERPLLWKAWDNLLTDDEGKLGKDEQKLIRLLAGPFFTKRLHPALYFAPRVR